VFLRLPAARHGLLEGGGGHVHRRHWHPIRHRADWVPGPPHEDPGEQAHHYGRTPGVSVINLLLLRH
jgi:hypothetical protein